MRESTTKNRVLTKQYRIPFLGEFWQLWGSVGSWYQLVILVSSVTAAFYSPMVTTYRGAYVPWLNLPMFFAILVAGSLIIMFLQYKFVQPSAAGYWNQIIYDHGNPMRDYIERMDRRDAAMAEIIIGLIPEGEQREKAKALLDAAKPDK